MLGNVHHYTDHYTVERSWAVELGQFVNMDLFCCNGKALYEMERKGGKMACKCRESFVR